MLYTKFHGNWPDGSGEEYFEGFLPFMGMAAILVMSSVLYSKIYFHVPKSVHTKFG